MPRSHCSAFYPRQNGQHRSAGARLFPSGPSLLLPSLFSAAPRPPHRLRGASNIFALMWISTHRGAGGLKLLAFALQMPHTVLFRTGQPGHPWIVLAACPRIQAAHVTPTALLRPNPQIRYPVGFDF